MRVGASSRFGQLEIGSRQSPQTLTPALSRSTGRGRRVGRRSKMTTQTLQLPRLTPVDVTPDDWPRRAIRRFSVMLADVTALFLATEAVGLAGWVPAIRPVSFGDISGNILFAIGFGSPLILYLSSLPGWRSVAITAVLAACVAAAPWRGHRAVGPPLVVTALGIASIATMGLRAWRSRSPANR